MTPGDIIRTPSGKYARYEGGVLGVGANFVYLDDNGKPKTYRGEPDSFCIASVQLLTKLQPVALGEWDRS